VKDFASRPSVTLIVPAYNEGARLRQSLGAILEYLNAQPYYCEVIVVDDGSTDETAAVVKSALFVRGRVWLRLLRLAPNRGKGYAVRSGLLAARAPIAVFTDADLSTPVTELPKLVDPIARGLCDVAFGSRAVNRRLIGIHQPWMREMAGRAFNLLVRAATRLPFSDTQCGFKAFRMDVCRTLLQAATIDRFGFDVELLYVAYRAGLRLLEIPVQWNHADGSKVSMRSDSLRMIRDLALIRRQADLGLYDGVIDGRALPARGEARQPRRVAFLPKALANRLRLTPRTARA
jgi:dolichyl-phosphate beta-glucosyltransferase